MESKHKKFIDFIKKYPEYFTIVENEKNIRIRLTSNLNWEHGDYIEEKNKIYFNYYLEYQIIYYIRTNGPNTIDNIMCNIYYTIKRGDLVKFIKRRHNIFLFDVSQFMVSLNDNFNVENYYREYEKNYWMNNQCETNSNNTNNLDNCETYY